MSMYRKLTTVAAVAALGFGLAACGGGGSDTPTATGPTGPTGMPVALATWQGGYIAEPGTYEVTGDDAALDTLLMALMGAAADVPEGGYAPGSAAVEVGDLSLMCSMNSASNCNIAVNDNYTVTITGTILVVASGGTFPDDRTGDQMRADTESDVVAGFSAAVTEFGNAEAAADDADTAEMTATTNSGKLDAVTVQGASGAAMTNAQSVLDQRGAVATALTNANTAKTDLETARNTAVGDPDVMGDTGNVPMDHPERDNLVAALNVAIGQVDGFIEDIEGVRDGTALKTALETVEKNTAYGYEPEDGDDPAVPGTARGVGESVAMDVAMVIRSRSDRDPTETTNPNVADRVNTIANAADTNGDAGMADPIFDVDGRLNFIDGPIPLRETDPASTHSRYSDKYWDGRVSRSWNQLAAHLGLTVEWLSLPVPGATPPARETVSARGAKVTGMDVPLTDPADPTSDPIVTGNVAERAAYRSTFKGLDGLYICWNGGCTVTDGKFASSDHLVVGTLPREGEWYFIPELAANDRVVDTFHPSGSRSRTYVADGNDGYLIDSQFARFGYWLETWDHDNDMATEEQLRMQRYALTAGNTANLNWADSDPDDGVMETGTYSGRAGGMSVIKGTRADDSSGPIRSGHFTADVELTATFGTAPMLGGTIDNFESVDHAVNPGWIVTLTEVAVTPADGATAIAAGEAEGSGPGGVGQNGVWTGTAYGPVQTPGVDGGDPTSHRPAGITGTFDAHFVDGHAAGVYATREKK